MFTRAAILIINQIGYLPLTKEDAKLFIQLVSARYKISAIVLSSNRNTVFRKRKVIGDPVIEMALLDQLLRHVIMIRVERVSYCGREYGDSIAL